MSSGYGQASLTDRMVRAARLDNSLYETVEHDRDATSQALTVVLIVAVASGIGQALALLFAGEPAGIFAGFLGGLVMAVFAWLIWSGLAYLVGTRLFQGTATYGELLRTIGFAQSPGILAVLAFIPFIGPLVAFAAGIWVLVATIVAMRQALDIDTVKAVLTAVVGFLIYLVVGVLLLAPFLAFF